MTNMNENKKVDIPDFVEDKDTDSTSVDMSIFKMSDEELYDDVPSKQENNEVKQTKKKSNATLILCLILTGVLLVTTVVSLIYAIKEHGNVSSLNDQIAQLNMQITDLNSKNAELTSKNTELQNQLVAKETEGTTVDAEGKYAKGVTLKITEDGNGMGVTTAANTEEFTDITLYWGDKVKLTADATKDSNGNYWGKTKDGYIRIEYNGEIWAEIDE